ncbi:MAG: DUF2332 domain-containing protein [Alteraurantiacibacter sp.]
MEIADIGAALEWHAQHCEKSAAPITARVIRALKAVMAGDSATGRTLREWPGQAMEDALALRVAGGVHFLFLSGAEPALSGVYRGEVTDQPAVDAIVCAAAEAHDAALLPWFDGPPQTNEAGRSASVMAALLWLSGKFGPRFELTEIGASAGINSMMARYFYDLGGTKVGPTASPMRIVPEWRGAAPPHNPVRIEELAACDIAPVDLTDPAAAVRLKGYIWADAQDRMQRMAVAIAMAGEQAPDLVAMDAEDFVRQRLARPQENGVTRAVFHTIMWQYLPYEKRQAIRAMLEEAGAKATADKPFAWIRLETNRVTFRHELSVKYWPSADLGGGEWTQLAEAHPHGAWVEWVG